MVVGMGGGLRMNKTVSKSCQACSYSRCHLFVKRFLPWDRKPLLRGSCLENFLCPVLHMFWNNMREHVVSLQIVAKFKYE